MLHCRCVQCASHPAALVLLRHAGLRLALYMCCVEGALLLFVGFLLCAFAI